MLLGEVERVLSAHGVSRRGDDLLAVACSGGMDSVALARALVELLGARRVIAAHVDHGVRAGSADDARFVVEWAGRLGVEVIVRRVSPKSAAEAELREVRYQALEVIRRESGASFLVTAHTEDDQAETVLLNLIRTARLARLAGIAERRGSILRPLLGVSRAEVRAYAARRGLEFREDPTNVEPAYLRNRIRKELLPLLDRRYRPGFARRVARLAAEVRGTLQARDERRAPAAVPPPRAAGTRPARLPAEPAGVEGPAAAVRFERRPWSGGPLPDGRACAIFDADVLQAPSIRPIRPGDRVAPFGLGGTRKVQDVLREAGVARERRSEVVVVTREDGAIVWVPGAVRSAHAPVSALTRSVWVFWMEQTAQLQAATRSVTLDCPSATRPATEGLRQEDE